MEQRILGNGGPELSVIGFGAWAIGGPWIFGWGKVDDAESVRALHRSLDLGVSWIDTAAAYGLGHSEEVVGRAVKGMSAKPFIATKCGLVSDGRGGVMNCLTPASIRAECEASLRRLGVGRIDLFQFHWPDPAVPVEESWGAMVHLQRAGKVRYIGVSNFDAPLLKRCVNVAPVQSLQPPYNLLERGVEETTLQYCLDQGIGVVAYSPMRSGLLTGRFDRTRLAPDDWRQKPPQFQDPELSRTLRFVEALRPLAKSFGMTVGQLAVAWVVSRPGVTSAIVGARTGRQAEENADPSRRTLTSADVGRIEQIYREFY
jgi:aryl-alcohol dehydrogenase-like predicted oxidoreductase